jgi:hypothetical protein
VRSNTPVRSDTPLKSDIPSHSNLMSSLNFQVLRQKPMVLTDNLAGFRSNLPL